MGEMVFGRANQLVLQLRRSPCGDVAQEQGGHRLGKRARRDSNPYLSATASRSAEVCQCAEVVGSEEGGPGRDLYGDDAGVAGGHVSLRPHWCSAHGGVWGILIASADRP